MAFVISNEGEKLLLEAALGKVAAGNLKLRLYTNNYTPTQTDTVASYTEMGAVQGYSLITLATGTWASAVAGTGSGLLLANHASIGYAQQTFTASGAGGAQTVFGYFVTDNGGTILLGGEKFATSKSYAIAGDAIKITPQVILSTE